MVPLRKKSKVAPSCSPPTTTHLPTNSPGIRFQTTNSQNAQVAPPARRKTRARTTQRPWRARVGEVADGVGSTAGFLERLVAANVCFMITLPLVEGRIGRRPPDPP